MFDFQKLAVYHKAKDFHKEMKGLAESVVSNDRFLANQLRRAALSIPINIAEGTGRFTISDRKHYFVVARDSTSECASIIDIMYSDQMISKEQFDIWLDQATEISKMLYALIKNMK